MPKVVVEEAPVDEVVLLPGAPLPPVAADFEDEAENGPSMEEVLLAAGAKRLPKSGKWYREVPDPTRAKERVVKYDPLTKQPKIYYATTLTRRWVATGADPQEAIAKARADKDGLTDAYLPGIGWLRCGRKREVEHPDNVGNVTRLAAPTRVVLEEAPVDSAEAEKAAALVAAASAASARQED